jgi:hypothetical protein
MLPCRIVLMLSRFQVVTECNPGMMRGLHMIARFVVLGGFAMMFGSLFIVLRCFFVMLVNLVLFHFILPDMSWLKGTNLPGINDAFAIGPAILRDDCVA